MTMDQSVEHRGIERKRKKIDGDLKMRSRTMIGEVKGRAPGISTH